jgi:hypothetical protein
MEKNMFPRLCKLMKQTAKITVCLVLCCALVWGYSYKEPVVVHAAPIVAVAGCVLAGLALSALGVYVAASCGQPQAQQFYQDCHDACATALDATTYTVNAVGQTVCNISTQALQAVGDWLTNYQNDYNSSEKQSVNFPRGWFFTDTGITGSMLDSLFDSTYYTSNYNWKYYRPDVWSSVEYVAAFDIPSVGQSTTVDMYTGGTLTVTNQSYKYYDSVGHNYNYINLVGSVSGGLNSMALRENVDTTKGTDTKNVVALCTNAAGKEYYVLLGATADMDCVESLLNQPTTTIPVGGSTSTTTSSVKPSNLIANGKSAIAAGETSADVIAALEERVAALEAGTVPCTNTGSNTAVDTKNSEQTQAQTTGATATAAETAASDTANEGKDTSTAKPTDMPDLSLPSLLTKKFPFSLPWDLYASVKTLVATPAPPKFTVPFLHITAWNVSQDITIDMSPYENVAVVCRWGFSGLWCIGLIFLTKKTIWK